MKKKLLRSLLCIVFSFSITKAVVAIPVLQIIKDTVTFEVGGAVMMSFIVLFEKINGTSIDLKNFGTVLVTPAGGAIAYGLRSQIPPTPLDVARWSAVIVATVATGILAQALFNSYEKAEGTDMPRKKSFTEHLIPGVFSGVVSAAGGGFAILAAPYITNALFPTSQPLVSTMPMSASTSF